jgi:phosphonate transport system substrate-binding protein
MKKISTLLWCLLALPALAADELVFGINEGVTYYVTPQETRDRYRELGELLSKALKRPVKLVAEDNYPKLQKALEEKRFDLAYVHPAHHSLRAIRDYKYQLVVVTKAFTDYRARFLIKSDARLKQASDIKGQRLVMPDADSITAWMVRATLRDLGVDPKQSNIGTTRYQDGIPFMMDSGFYDVGATASGAVIKQWQSAGGKILFESKPVPIKHLIAAPTVSAGDVAKIRELFLNLENTKDGQAILAKLGFKGYQTAPDQQIADLTKWLGI